MVPATIVATKFNKDEKIWNNKIILTFLQSPYKSPCIFSPYVKLTNGIMWEWFTKDGMLKEIYIQVVECETTKKYPK